MAQQQVSIQAKDGTCPATVFTPEGKGPWPAVIFYMDAFGIRPAMKQMAAHIAEQGYVVLLPDLFYRIGKYEELDPKEVFKGDFRAIVGPRMSSTDNLKTAEDTASFLAYLDTRSDIAGKKVATVGFCMGGGMAITAAGFYPERIAAVGSFHAGNIFTDQPTSPHLQAPKIKAELLVASADKDHSCPPEMIVKFDEALLKAHVRFKSELFEGKMHGWMKPDMPVFDAAAADRGWREFFALCARNLR